ncbi:MAG: sulfatase-like hydrolase/transferase [Gammaproteobacteria bacterium]|nr:sulfatase-like hydrolase/transferase [Gammaproteobacteria bacterium]MDH5214119.1 sulfatase-like hydrolase/transferase [Gammaproteobacteria bacterium]
MNRRLQVVLPIVAELLLWLLPAVAFLGVYVLYFNGPDAAVGPHLKLVGSMAFAWLGLRLLVEHSKPGRFTETAFQILYSLGLVFLLLYYVMILIGLGSWGRVPTWRLVAVYFDQWRELLAVLDAPVILVPIILGAIFALVFLLVRAAHARLRWPQQFAQFARWPVSFVLAACGLIAFATFALETYAAVDRHSGEPIMLSLNSGIGAQAAQSNPSGAKLLDKREAEAAAAYRPGVLGPPRNVILIVGDALRSDHLGVLQYSRPTTPYLDSLAKAGRFALMQRAYSVCAESYCGLMSIARSKFVHEFSRESLTLQQVLARHDYRIGLILSGDHTNFYGLSEALGPTDLYWDGTMGNAYVNDDRAVVERVSELPDWDGKPTFLQLHLMSSHGLGQRHDEFVQFTPATNYYRRWTGASEEKRRIEATNFYDNGILQFDATIKALLETLQDLRYLENAVVVITGDHGEMLGEQGHYTHAETVYAPVLDIPLLILRFGYTGPAIMPRAFASQVDIAPTLLQELGLPVPDSWSGSGLRNPMTREFSYFQQAMDIGLFDLREPERVWKFWTNIDSQKAFAFDAMQDPAESRNRIAELPANLRSEWMLQLVPAGVSTMDLALDKVYRDAAAADSGS